MGGRCTPLSPLNPFNRCGNFKVRVGGPGCGKPRDVKANRRGVNQAECRLLPVARWAYSCPIKCLIGATIEGGDSELTIGRG